MATVERPLRADAERNRRRILAAARALFAERGLAVTLDDVAERAGLGVGTVYRRFRSRVELVDALFAEQLDAVVALADEALTIEDPWTAVVRLVTGMAAFGAENRGLKEVLLGSGEGRSFVAQARAELRPRSERLVVRAQAAGVLRPDFDAGDLPMLQLMTGVIAELDPGLWRRFLALLLDGMRVGGGREPLPEPPLPFERLDEVMCRWRPPRWQREP